MSPGSRRELFAAATLVLAPLVMALPGGADTVVVPASRDNTLYEDTFGSLSNGAGSYLFTGRTELGALRRGLVAFDVSAIPPGSTVSSATLTLRMSRTITGSTTVSVHRVVADWGEGTSQAAMGEGIGAPATPGDATWTYTFFDTESWAMAGGDFVGASSAQATIGAIAAYSWGSTAELVADVQGWVNAPATNFGWILVGDETTSSAKRFDSRDNGDPANAPRLEVVFTPPPATSIPAGSLPGRLLLVVLLAGAGAWVVSRRS